MGDDSVRRLRVLLLAGVMAGAAGCSESRTRDARIGAAADSVSRDSAEGAVLAQVLRGYGPPGAVGLIGDSTVTDTSIGPDVWASARKTLAAAAPGDSSALPELVADFHAANRLARHLSAWPEVAAYRSAAAGAQPGAGAAGTAADRTRNPPGERPLVTVSRVGFDRTLRLALAYTTYCVVLCRSGRLLLLGREGSGWRVVAIYTVWES